MKRQKTRKLLLLLSFLLFPITLFYFSPYLIIQGGVFGIVSGSFCIFVALFLFSLFFGRAFCGWICAAGSLQEYCSQVNPTPIRTTKINLIKYVFWIPWIIGILLAFFHAGGIHKIDFFYMTEHGISAASIPGMITYFAIIALITILALTLGRRGMCHSFCWMAPFMIIGSKIKTFLPFPSLCLISSSQNCVGCNQCNRVCPMGLDVSNMVKNNHMTNAECILCGECVDTCKKNAICYKITK